MKPLSANLAASRYDFAFGAIQVLMSSLFCYLALSSIVQIQTDLLATPRKNLIALVL